MGLREWWAARKQRQANTRRSLEINDDQNAIAEHAPELVGMTFVEGAAYVLHQIELFNETATLEHSAVFAGRLAASNQAWMDEGLTMPYWANLWVLRTLQAQIAEGVDLR